MTKYQLKIGQPRPYFAELPYYIWGDVNYDSEGDCDYPTDRSWNWLWIRNRESDEDESIDLNSEDGANWVIAGPDPLASRATLFMMASCEAEVIGEPPVDNAGDWNHEAGLRRAEGVQAVFRRPELAPFDVGHLFWGSWKWIGWKASEYTWVGRMIMHSVLTQDARAVVLCIDWLRGGVFAEEQAVALRYALARLTGESFESSREWVEWYYDGPGEAAFPEPDFQAWHADLVEQLGDT